MTSIKTSSGFSCDVDESAMNDMELLEDLAAIDGGDIAVLPSALSRIVGSENKRKLYDHVRVNGRVPIDSVSQEIGEIITQLGSKKKSLPSPE